MAIAIMSRHSYTGGMTPNDALEFFGTKSEIARVIGIEVPSVCGWFEKGEIPEPRQYQVELATNGQLRASKPADRRKPS